MQKMTTNAPTPAFWDKAQCDVSDLEKICARQTRIEAYPNAASLANNVVVYDGQYLEARVRKNGFETTLLSELHSCLATGPGVLVIRNAYADRGVIDEVTEVFFRIIATEKMEARVAADHFGENERIWNALQKVCVAAPDLFIPYYGNLLLALVARAWLGPAYQMTAQVNNVKPGSSAQQPHRDYHLGFQTAETVAQYPARTQLMSQYLTLQGAIAHADMPLTSGPTLLLPYSHQYPAGYLAFGEPDFIAFFQERAVQLPLAKGDVIFFSPALYHGAGHNRSKADRLANLLQISSAFGRAMESVNRHAMLEAVYPCLLQRQSQMTALAQAAAIAAVAEGYAFPTNLDTDPPLGGHAPRPAADLVQHALNERWTWEKLNTMLDTYMTRRGA